MSEKTKRTERALAVYDRIVNSDMTQDEAQALLARHGLTPEGVEQVGYIEDQQEATRGELERGIGLSALSAADQAALAEFASYNPDLDQEQIEKIASQMARK